MITTSRRLITLTLTTLILCASLGTAALAAPSRSDIMRPAPVEPEKQSVLDPDALVRKALIDALAARRAVQIERLKAYLELGLFPRNRVTGGLANIFRDGDGLLCAIAYLINADGLTALVEDTATRNNLVKIGELERGPLLSWVLASGLTQEEVAFIQLPDSNVGMGGQDWFIAENNRIRAHIASAIERLEQNNAKSVELAAERLLARAKTTTKTKTANK